MATVFDKLLSIVKDQLVELECQILEHKIPLTVGVPTITKESLKGAAAVDEEEDDDLDIDFETDAESDEEEEEWGDESSIEEDDEYDEED